jgi:hypothetical protein
MNNFIQNFESKLNLVLYPESITPHNFISYLISLLNQKIIVICQNERKIKNSLNGEYPDVKYITYKENDTETSGIEYLQKDNLILIDSYVLFKSLIPSDLNGVRSTIIFIETKGIVNMDINTGIRIYKFNILDKGPILNYKVNKREDKVNRLLELILSNPNHKHYIYTAKYINDITKIFKQYDIEYITILDGKKYTENTEVVSTLLNTANGINIVISNITPTCDIPYISSVHIIDNCDLNTYRNILRKTYLKKFAYKDTINFNINFYINNTEDIIFYEDFIKYTNLTTESYDDYYNNAKCLKV